MKKNDLLEITVEDITSDGFGIGKFNGFAVFIHSGAIEDKLLVRILKVKKNYAYGKIEKILVPSKYRIVPDCPHYRNCGGCTLRHISYDAELDLKYNRVRNCIQRIGGFHDLPINPIVKADNIDFYRNKAQIPVRYDSTGQVVAGFYNIHSHKISDCTKCTLHPQLFNQISCKVIEWINKHHISVYNESSNTGLIRHIYIRIAEKTDQIMICLVINGDDIPFKNEFIDCMINNFKNIKSIVLNINKNKTNVILGTVCKTLWGTDYITDELCGLSFNISPLSFYQVNRNQAEKLYKIAKECAQLSGNDTLLDMYCGTGTIGIYMSKYVGQVIGVEIIKQAIDNANINAINNNIKNIKFICDDAENAVKKLDVIPNVIVLDPPRKGCTQDVIKDICSIGPQKIIYISCEPSTLARDMKILSEYNYYPQKVVPVDLFPRTGHVETVVLMLKI